MNTSKPIPNYHKHDTAIVRVDILTRKLISMSLRGQSSLFLPYNHDQ